MMEDVGAIICQGGEMPYLGFHPMGKKSVERVADHDQTTLSPSVTKQVGAQGISSREKCNSRKRSQLLFDKGLNRTQQAARVYIILYTWYSYIYYIILYIYI